MGHIDYRPIVLDTGAHDGTVATSDGLELGSARGVRDYADPFAAEPARRRFAHASWTSPAVEPGFAFDELVPTWHAQTPHASWVEVAARARTLRTRRWSPWLVVARWADHDSTMHATSVGNQRCDGVSVATDTVRTPDGADAWQLRFTLFGTA